MNAISSKNHRRKFIRKQFKKLAYALTHNELQKVYKKFIEVDCLQATNFLAISPPEHFVNAYFPGYRYDDLCSTISLGSLKTVSFP